MSEKDLGLWQMATGSTEDANALFGEHQGLMLIRPGRPLCSLWLTVPEGCYAFVSRVGADLIFPGSKKSFIWSSGLYWLPPWYKVSCLVTKQNVIYDCPVKGCKTKDNVTVTIDIAVMLRVLGDEAKGEDPDMVKKFVYQVTPAGLQQQLNNAIEEEIRAVARSLRHSEVYGLRSVTVAADAEMAAHPTSSTTTLDRDGENEEKGMQMIKRGESEEDKNLIGSHDTADENRALNSSVKGQGAAERMVLSLNRLFEPQGVQIVDIMIEDVRLPEDIVKQMEKKTMTISETAHQKMTQQFEMQQLKFQEEGKQMEQLFSEERAREQQQGNRQVNEVNIRLNNLKAEADKIKRKIDEDSRVVIQDIDAQMNLEVARLNQEMNKSLAEMRANAESEAARFNAETDKYVEEKMAEAKLQAARNDAQSSILLSDAEGRIAPMLEKKKEFETDLRKLQVFKSLAQNPELVLSGSDDSDLNTLLLCDSILKGRAAPDRSQMLAELMVTGRGSRLTMDTSNGAVKVSTGGNF